MEQSLLTVITLFNAEISKMERKFVGSDLTLGISVVSPSRYSSDTTLECPYCRQYKTVPRSADLPAEVRLIQIICPDCDDGDRHAETWFSAPGVEVSQDRGQTP